MDSKELRKLQLPLKEQYRNNPESAIFVLKAEGKLDYDISFLVKSRGKEFKAGLHPATGGDGTLACSANILLEALVACAGVTMSAVATAIGVEITNCNIKAEGTIDFRGNPSKTLTPVKWFGKRLLVF